VYVHPLDTFFSSVFPLNGFCFNIFPKSDVDEVTEYMLTKSVHTCVYQCLIEAIPNVMSIVVRMSDKNDHHYQTTRLFDSLNFHSQCNQRRYTVYLRKIRTDNKYSDYCYTSSVNFTDIQVTPISSYRWHQLTTTRNSMYEICIIKYPTDSLGSQEILFHYQTHYHVGYLPSGHFRSSRSITGNRRHR
jgi:hypothetical protein